MADSIVAPYGLETNNPQPEIKRYYNLAKTPYVNTAQAISEILETVRYRGQTVSINGVEYWWKDNTTDSGLVLKAVDISGKVDKVAGERLINASEITKLSNQSGVNTGDQNISGIATNASAITALQSEQTTQNNAIALNTAKVGITPTQAAIIAATSGTNTGDQDLSNLAPKNNPTFTGSVVVPNATQNNQAVNLGQLNSVQITVGEEFYYDENDILRPNISTYRQVEIATQVNQTFTLAFEPTFISSVIKDGIYLLQSQYIYTAPNQLQVLTNSVGQTIEITYDKFIIQP